MGLSVKLLGEFAIRDENGKILSLPTRKTRALLAYLAVNADKPQQRDRLMAFLWGDRGEQQARHSLNQALTSIRRLGNAARVSVLDGNGERVTLLGDAIAIDVTDFREQLANDPARAAELYEGPFLDGLTIPDPAFEEWVAGTRLDFHRHVCDALERAADRANENGELDLALAAAQRLVALDSLRESAHRRLMTLLQKSGDRAGALRHYQTCADILLKELNVEPEAATKALYESIKGASEVAATVIERLAEAAAGSDRSPSMDKPSIAILPFVNLAGNPDQEYLVKGIQLAIYATLIKVSGMFLIEANSVANSAQSEDAAERAGRVLGARFVLEGAVQTAGKRVRVTVQLTDTVRGTVIWVEHYDRVLDDFFALQDEIALEVLAELDIKLISGEEVRIFRNTLTSTEVKDIYYRALSHFYAGTKADSAAAIELFTKVASMQPDSLEGPSYLCFTHYWSVFAGWSENPRESMARALDWARIADKFEFNNGLAHIVIASDQLLNRRHDDALETCYKGYSYRPSCPAANSYLANILHYCGKSSEAVVRAKEGLRLLPSAPAFFTNVLAAAYRENGDIDHSIAAAKESLRRSNEDIEARTILCCGHVLAGASDDAKRIAEEILSIDPDFSLAKFADTQPFRDAATLENIVDCLREAGLPE